MKTSKILLIGLAALLGAGHVVAQDNLSVVLKGGSLLTGYISRQCPGENLMFTTSRAEVALHKGDVKSIVDSEINVRSLSPEWVAWAEDNNVFVGSGDDRRLLLSDIITTTSTIHNVRVLERGAKVRYLELAPNTYSFGLDSIVVIRAEKRPKLMLSGVNRRYKLASGMEYEGQYVEEIPGQTMSLLRDNGIIEVFNTSEVLKDSRYKINPNQSLVEQSDLLDVVYLKNGNIYRGIIFERNYSEGSKISTSDYLLIELENGSRQSVNLAEVAEYHKERNPAYNPLTDIELDEGQAAINRIVTAIRPTQEEEGAIKVDVEDINVTIPLSEAKSIVAEFAMGNTAAGQLKLIKIHQYRRTRRPKTTFHGFTYESLFNAEIKFAKIETSVNGISLLEYTLPRVEAGIYGVYNPDKKNIVLFRIGDSDSSK